VLEEQTFRRLGGLRDINVDLRIIAATNKNLREAVKEGAFRQDLYYRLNVIQLVVPPLRERQQDILPMANFFIDRYNLKFKRQIEGLTPEAEALLLAHGLAGQCPRTPQRHRARHDPRGDFRDFSSQPAHCRQEFGSIHNRFSPLSDGEPREVHDGMSLADQERRLLVQALAKTAGNQTQAARILRITRDTLRYKMKKFNLR